MIEIQGGPREKSGRSVVVAMFDGQEHVDKFDLDDAFKRQKFREAVVSKFGLSDDGDAHAFIENELIRLANIEDAPSNGQPKPGPVVTKMSDIAPCEIKWLWPGRVPLGRITLMVGRPGEGKSFVTTDWAARVSTGTPWPDGGDCPKGSVLLVCAEDDPGDTIRPRLDAHYADVDRVHLLSGVRFKDADGDVERMITLADVACIEIALEQIGDTKLLVVDPIGSFLGGRTDAHRDNEVRGVLAPIAKLAEKYGVAVLVVAHRRKSPGASADDLALGSRAFTGIARSVWHLSRDRENKNRRLLLPGKNNLAAEGTGLAFSIGGDPPSIRWERDPIEMSADDGVAAEQSAERPGPQAEAMSEASDFLREALADGARPAAELVDEAKQMHGIAEKTLRRAKKELGVEAFRPENPGPWHWRAHGQADGQVPPRKITWPSGPSAKNCGKNGHSGEPERADGQDQLLGHVDRLEDDLYHVPFD